MTRELDYILTYMGKLKQIFSLVGPYLSLYRELKRNFPSRSIFAFFRLGSNKTIL